MAVLDQDLTIIGGNDYAIPVQLYDGDSGSTALDLTGVSAITYKVRRQASDGYAALISKSLGAGIAVTGNPTAGLVTLTLTDEDTLDTSPEVRLEGYFHHEMQVVDSGGNKSTVFQGILTIRGTGA